MDAREGAAVGLVKSVGISTFGFESCRMFLIHWFFSCRFFYFISSFLFNLVNSRGISYSLCLFAVFFNQIVSSSTNDGYELVINFF